MCSSDLEGHYHGVTSLSKDSTILYLFVPSVKNGDKEGMVPMMIKGLRNKILSATVVGDRTECAIKIVGKISWSSVPGTVFMDLPVRAMDEYMTVVRLQLDGPIKLYRGKGGFSD